MPLGTETPRHYPANTGAHSSFGTKFMAMESRADCQVLEWYLLGTEEAVTLYANSTLGDRGLNIVTGTSVATGWMLELYEDGHVFQCSITNVSAEVGYDTLTIDTPLPYAFTIVGATGRVGIRNAAVDGDDPDVPFTIAPPANHIWDITKLGFHIDDQTAMTTGLFGGITALTSGVCVRVYRSATVYDHIETIHSNLYFFLHNWETSWMSNMVASHYGINSYKIFGNEREDGAVLRLNGTLGEYLEVLVSDDLTDLDLFKLFAHGYVLQDGIPGPGPG